MGVSKMSFKPAMSRVNLKAVVGPEPCLQCTESQRMFCASKGLKCKAFEAYEDSGVTYVTSATGWALPTRDSRFSAKGRKTAQIKLALVQP